MTTELPRVSTGPSIYDFIRSHVDAIGRRSGAGQSLPDEAPATDDEIRFAPGAADGAFGHHFGGGNAPDQAGTLADLLIRAAIKPSRRRLQKLYRFLTERGSTLDYVDALLEELATKGADRAAVRRIGRWLATQSADREPVKLGIALLGATGLDDATGVVRTLGAHDEFTLYAAVAMTNGLEEPDSELWALASAVDGWGRIECVERLRDTTDPQIRSWILRQGYRNSVMYEYLAHIAATTGGLLDALEAPEVDRELLTAAGEILEALINGGPAEDIDDYEEGAAAVGAYLGHIRSRAETLDDFAAVAAIRGFLRRDDWEERSTRGWTATTRTAYEETCEAILLDPKWLDLVDAGLHATEPTAFWRAEAAARELGLDTFDIHLDRIRADPLAGPWFHAWQQADRARAVLLADTARRTLPLDELAIGPGRSLGFGPGTEGHRALEWTLQALRDFPGVGGDLILVGLRSPVIRSRNMCLTALESWPRDQWPDGASELVATTASSDPDERTRELAAQVLRAAGVRR